MANSIDIRNLNRRKEGPAKKKNDPGYGHSANSAPADGSDSVLSSQNGLWSFLNKDISLFGGRLPDKIKESFYLELGSLLAAGIDIRASLELIRDEQSKMKHKQIFGNILQQIEAGSTLSSAMKAAGVFTAYEYFSIQIGEETGKLVKVLGELAIYFKTKIDQSRQIIGALTYPVLVLIIAGLAVSFMMTYVVPMFADVLKRFGGDLPFITKLVLRLSVLIRKFSLLLFVFLIGVTILVISQRKKDWFRKWVSAIILRIPVIGDIIRKIYLSRFANTMSLLIGSRIPMLQSIQLVKKMVNFYPIESSLEKVEGDVLSGIPLYKSFSYHSVYPKKMISLIKVGEEVNQLDIFFSKISAQYSGEVEYRTNLLSKFLEPMIIVVLGFVVGVILIAMYLPLFKLGQAF